MAERDLVDHSKSSWQALLPLASTLAFVLVQRSKLTPIPKVALAGVVAGFTYGSMQKKTPKLGGVVAGVMASYAVVKGLGEVGKPPGARTGLSWEEMEQATPDLAAAKRAAQMGIRAATWMPALAPLGWHIERAIFQ